MGEEKWIKSPANVNLELSLMFSFPSKAPTPLKLRQHEPHFSSFAQVKRGEG